MPVDVEENFDELLLEDRHKELISALRKVVESINNKKDEDLSKSIASQSMSISLLIKKLEENQSDPAMSAAMSVVLTNQVETIKVLESILAESKKMREWKFDVSIDQYSERIKTVIAKQLK